MAKLLAGYALVSAHAAVVDRPEKGVAQKTKLTLRRGRATAPHQAAKPNRTWPIHFEAMAYFCRIDLRSPD